MTTDQQVQIFLDEIDAAKHETEFWNAVARKDGPHGILRGHRVTLIQNGAELGGLTAIARDDYNRTVLVCVDLKELASLRREVQQHNQYVHWQNMPNRNPASRGAYEFYINEEWMGIAGAAIDKDARCCATLRKHRMDPDDERVRIRRVKDDDGLLQDLKAAQDKVALLEEAARGALKYMQSKMPSNWRYNHHASKLAAALAGKAVK